MKHTDQVLGISKVDPILPEEREARRRYFDGIASQLQTIQRLKNDPGYQLFIQELQAEESNAIDRLEAADGSNLAKAAGVLLAVRGYKTWADDRIEELQGILNAQE